MTLPTFNPDGHQGAYMTDFSQGVTHECASASSQVTSYRFPVQAVVAPVAVPVPTGACESIYGPGLRLIGQFIAYQPYAIAPAPPVSRPAYNVSSSGMPPSGQFQY